MDKVYNINYQQQRQIVKEGGRCTVWQFGVAMMFRQYTTKDGNTVVTIDLPAYGTDWWERFFGVKQNDVFLQIAGNDTARVELEINDFIDRHNKRYAQMYGVQNKFHNVRR